MKVIATAKYYSLQFRLKPWEGSSESKGHEVKECCMVYDIVWETAVLESVRGFRVNG